MKFIYSHQLKNKLYRFASKLMNDNEEAKDIAQDVFVRLLQKKELKNENHNIDALAMKMVRDMCFDRIRHLNTKQDKLIMLANSNSSINQANYELKDIYQIIDDLVKDLPEKQQVIFRLRDIQELDFDEIAGLLNMEESTVRMNLSRARKNIREQLVKIQNYGL